MGNESFIRWQGRTIDALGNAITLILSLCLATIGFVISKLLDKDFEFQHCSTKTILFVGISIIFISIIIILILIYNRLLAFRLTSRISRKREKEQLSEIDNLRNVVSKKDSLTWTLFKASILTFFIGEILIIIGFIIEVANK